MLPSFTKCVPGWHFNMIASKVLMVRPANFGFNTETAVNNTFQNATHLSGHEVQNAALIEFDRFAQLLLNNGIEVMILEDSPEPVKPDAVFPNNWFSSHPNGQLILYPMFSQVRRLERRTELAQLVSAANTLHLTDFESKGRFLEGTGSLVFDHANKTVYAALSARTNEELVTKVAAHLGYKVFTFTTADRQGNSIYHTNVVMSVSDTLAIVCVDCVTDRAEELKARLKETKEVIEISLEQMENFCGNCLLLQNKKGEKFLVMSERAHNHFTGAQIALIEKHARLLSAPLDTIESVGGGSARCMLAEIFN